MNKQPETVLARSLYLEGLLAHLIGYSGVMYKWRFFFKNKLLLLYNQIKCLELFRSVLLMSVVTQSNDQGYSHVVMRTVCTSANLHVSCNLHLVEI